MLPAVRRVLPSVVRFAPRRVGGKVLVSTSDPLPLTPSSNHLFLDLIRKKRNRKGKLVPRPFRVKSPEYREWLAAVVPVLARMASVQLPVEATVRVYGGDGLNLSRDVANFEKATMDAAVKAKVIPGDSIRDGVWSVVTKYIPVDSESKKAYVVLCLVSIDTSLWPRTTRG